jgi:hypothetical protein
VLDEDIGTLASRCVHLTDVDLSWCSSLSAASVAALSDHCPGLERLHLRCCQDVSASAVCELLGRCAARMQALPAPSRLQLAPNPRMAAEVMKAAAPAHTCCRSCPALSLLNLNRCSGEIDDQLPPHMSSDARSPSASEGHLISVPCRLIQPITECTSLTWLDVGWLSALIDGEATRNPAEAHTNLTQSRRQRIIRACMAMLQSIRAHSPFHTRPSAHEHSQHSRTLPKRLTPIAVACRLRRSPTSSQLRAAAGALV